MKKNLFLFVFLLATYFPCLALDDEIILKNGSRTTIKANSFKVDDENKSITYFTASNIQMKIKFNEFDYAEIGKNKFQVIKLENHSYQGFFVLTETESKKLLLKTELSEEETENKFKLFILDNKNTLIEEYNLDANLNNKSTTLRSEIYAILKYHFSECTQFIERLELYDRNIGYKNNVRILQFFKNPIYNDYRKSKK